MLKQRVKIKEIHDGGPFVNMIFVWKVVNPIIHFSVSKEARFGLWMSVFLASVMHCSGFMALIQFTATIFEESGSSLPPNEAAIIVAALQTLGCYASSFLVERFGRKILLLFSCSSTAISLGILGSYSYLDRHGFDVTEHNWIPIVSFAAAIFLVSLGVTAVSLTIMTEILLPEVRRPVDWKITIYLLINFFRLKILGSR